MAGSTRVPIGDEARWFDDAPLWSSGSLEGWQGLQECQLERKPDGLTTVLCGGSGSVEGWQGIQDATWR